MEDLRTIFAVHFALTCAMAGLVWFVQGVHYPLMRRVAEADFAAYEKEHSDRCGLVIGPLMVAELVSGFWLWFLWPQGGLLYATAMLLLLALWASTFYVQVPLHRRLARGWDREAWRRLVLSNWFRTLGWTGRVLLLGWIGARGVV